MDRVDPVGYAFTGGTLTLAGALTAARTITLPDASGTLPLLSLAQAFTAAQTIDLGSGALPTAVSPAATLIRIAQADGTTSAAIQSDSWTGASPGGGLDFLGRTSGGTRASPGATVGDSKFAGFGAFGHDGTSYSSQMALMRIMADGTWSGTNRGTYFDWAGTPNGSTTRGIWMVLRNALLALGMTPVVGEGALQFPSHTTRAGGIALSDVPIFRAAAGVLGLGDGSVAVSTATTVGAAGGGSALPATPVGYLRLSINGTIRKIPYYND